MNDFVSIIYLNLFQSIAFIGICLYIILKGHPEWALGIYLSMAGWNRTVKIGSIAHTWILITALALAYVVQYLKHKDEIRGRPNSSWIIPWVIIWWGWTLLLIIINNPDTKITFYRSIILGVIIPVVMIFLMDGRVKVVVGFAFAYVMTTLIGGLVAISMLGISFLYLVNDPTLSRIGVVRLGLYNYHWFGYTFGISLILCIGFFIYSKNKIVKLLSILICIYCTYFILLSGSRQTLGAAIISGIVLLSWTWRYSIKKAIGSILIVVTLSFLAIYLVNLAPNLVIRSGSYDSWSLSGSSDRSLIDAFNLFNNRGKLWGEGLDLFIKSPIWGTGYMDYNTSHNLFISILANEGLVGFIMMVGFWIFFLNQCRKIWSGVKVFEFDLWRFVLFSIVIFGLVQSQASGSQISVWHIWWGTGFMWRMNDSFKDKQWLSGKSHKYKTNSVSSISYPSI